MIPGVCPSFTYTLTQVKNIVALSNLYMDPRETQLSKLPFKANDVIFFNKEIGEFLKEENNFEWLRQKTEEIMTTLKQNCAKCKGKSCKFCQSDSNHLWARLLKSYVQEGNILNQSDPSCTASWLLFLQEMKEIFSENISKMDPNAIQDINFRKYNFTVDPIQIQKCFLSFMGQLSKTKNVTSVEVIHNFLYVIKKIASAEATSGMSCEQLAPTIAPTMLHGIQLATRLCRPAATGIPAENVLFCEYKFMTAICNAILNHDFFNHPFNAATYENFFQPMEDFQLKMASLPHESTLSAWAVPALYLGSADHTTPAVPAACDSPSFPARRAHRSSAELTRSLLTGSSTVLAPQAAPRAHTVLRKKTQDLMELVSKNQLVGSERLDAYNTEEERPIIAWLLAAQQDASIPAPLPSIPTTLARSTEDTISKRKRSLSSTK